MLVPKESSAVGGVHVDVRSPLQIVYFAAFTAGDEKWMAETSVNPGCCRYTTGHGSLGSLVKIFEPIHILLLQVRYWLKQLWEDLNRPFNYTVSGFSCLNFGFSSQLLKVSFIDVYVFE
jgi:hypothetical protein